MYSNRRSPCTFCVSPFPSRVANAADACAQSRALPSSHTMNTTWVYCIHIRLPCIPSSVSPHSISFSFSILCIVPKRLVDLVTDNVSCGGVLTSNISRSHICGWGPYGGLPSYSEKPPATLRTWPSAEDMLESLSLTRICNQLV